MMSLHKSYSISIYLQTPCSYIPAQQIWKFSLSPPITREKLYNIDECIANMYSIDHAEFIIGNKLLLEISEVYSGASEKRTLQDIASVRSSLSRRLFCIKIINLCISECPLLGGSVNRGSTV